MGIVRASCAMLRASCARLRASCARLRASCDRLLASYMLRASCNRLSAPANNVIIKICPLYNQSFGHITRSVNTNSRSVTLVQLSVISRVQSHHQLGHQLFGQQSFSHWSFSTCICINASKKSRIVIFKGSVHRKLRPMLLYISFKSSLQGDDPPNI